MAKRPTLNDVVEMTGLSIFTVSRALNNAEGVSAKSRKRVLEAARAIGYVPNTVARSLRSQAPGPIVVMTASSSNYYYIEMIEGIQLGIRESGMQMRMADLAPNGVFEQSIEDEVVQEAMQARSSGVISTLTLSIENYTKLTEWGIPVVFVDSEPPKTDFGAASVTTDNADATELIGNHLATHGVKEWVLLMYPHRWSTRRSREEGMRESAKLHGANLRVLESGNDPDSAKDVVLDLLNAPRETGKVALIAGNNPLLQGAFSALKDSNIEIPDEVILVAFDEFPWSDLVAPPITLVDEHSKQIGEKAGKKITELIARSKEAQKETRACEYSSEDQTEVKASLIVRNSCGCI